jgi:hypothetical protein
VGHQLGFAPCVGFSKDLASFGSVTGGSGTEVGFGHENLSPIPGWDLGFGIPVDASGPTGLQLNIAPEAWVMGSEGHIYETRTWIFP